MNWCRLAKLLGKRSGHLWGRTGEAVTVGTATRLRWACQRGCGVQALWLDMEDHPTAGRRT